MDVEAQTVVVQLTTLQVVGVLGTAGALMLTNLVTTLYVVGTVRELAGMVHRHETEIAVLKAAGA